MSELYYEAYEKRYQAVYAAGVENWGHSSDNKVLYNALKNWVEENNLKGKKIIEFACGEGASGVILSELGCVYFGVDISPSAIEKTAKKINKYPNAKCKVLDMVKDQPDEKFDAALDCMGLHMLVTDSDRENYLKNAYEILNDGAPMLFFRESYRREGTYQGTVNSFDEWVKITGEDYETLQNRYVRNKKENKDVEVFIPLLPARAKDEKGYVKEFENVGFKIEKFIEMDVSEAIVSSASIFVRK